MATMDRLGDMAHGVQDGLDQQIKQVSRWMKPYTKSMSKVTDDLRPYARQAMDVARKHPGKTFAGALLFGYLFARFTRR